MVELCHQRITTITRQSRMKPIEEYKNCCLYSIGTEISCLVLGSTPSYKHENCANGIQATILVLFNRPQSGLLSYSKYRTLKSLKNAWRHFF